MVAGAKLLFALLGFSAVVTEIATLQERGRFMPWNFFSYFTIESNLLAVAVLIAGSLVVARGQPSRHVAMVRGAATLSMAITGVVFSVLLAGIRGAELTAVPWDNIVLHYIMPVAMVLDWGLDRPGQLITFKHALIWLIFPLVYVVYSVVRGPFAHWYPYPFLNPDRHGYVGVVMTSSGIAGFAAGLVWVLTRLTNSLPVGARSA